MVHIFHVLKLAAIIFFVEVVAERPRFSVQVLGPDQDIAGKEHCPQLEVLLSVLAKLGITEPTPHLRNNIAWNECKVVGINLRDETVVGTLDHDIGKLENLRQLELGHSQVTVELSMLQNLRGLQHLDLGATQIEGDLAILQGLTKMQVLNLYNSNITGELSSLQKLTQLQELRLHNTRVAGDLSSLHGLSKLRWLSLRNTKVAGNLASLRGLTQIENLYLSYTGVVGDVASLQDLVRLKDLWLYNTEVTGELTSVQNLSQMQNLYLSNTMVRGNLVSLRGLTQLQVLYLDNTKVGGELASLQSLRNVTELHLANTSVAGDVAALLPWNHVITIDLEQTHVTGRLSSKWRGRLPKLRSLKLSRSKVEFLPRHDELQELQSSFFTPAHPDFAAKVILPLLNLLALNECPLDGDVNELLLPLGGCPALATIEADNCSLNGTLTNLKLTTRVDGKIWSEWTSPLAKSLKVLNLRSNSITEIKGIPEEMQVLILAENSALSFADGVLKAAVTSGTFVDLQNVALSNAEEAAELLDKGFFEKTEQVSTMSTEGGYECHSIVSTALQISPDKFLPDELCKCQAGFEGAGARCERCRNNSYSKGNSNKCTPCPDGSFAIEGETTCKCASGGQFLPNETPGCQCRAQYALLANLKGRGDNETCVPCAKSNLMCSDQGMLLTTAPPEIGFARLRENDTEAVACLAPRDTRCNTTDSNGSNHFGCANGYGGVLCSDCQAGHYLTRNTCEQCPTIAFTQQIWSVAAVAGGIGTLAVGFLACMWLCCAWGDESTAEMSSVAAQFSAVSAFKEQVKQLAPMLLQTCQLWAVLAALMKNKAGRGPSKGWEIPFIEASQFSVDSLKGAMNLQCVFNDGAFVRLASALVAPVAPMTVLLGCLSVEICCHGFGIGAALKALTLFYVGGVSGASKLLRCQEVNGERGLLPKELVFRKVVPHLLCADSSSTYLNAVGYSGLVFYGFVVPLCLGYLYARQHLALLPGKATVAIAAEEGGKWEMRLSELERQNFERQDPLVDREEVRVRRLLAASAAHIAVKLQGRVQVVLKDGVVVAKRLSGGSRGPSKEVPEASRGSIEDWQLEDLSDLVEARVGKNKSHALPKAMMDRCLLEEAEASDRALAGAKHILVKYSRCQSFYLEIIQKLVAVALVSVVNSDDGLQMSLAITLFMAVATGMVQPYFHPQANILQCCSFFCLALAAVGFSSECIWLSRAALAVPFLLSAALALRPDSTESLAVRIWRQMEKEISKLQDGQPLEILVETVSFV